MADRESTTDKVKDALKKDWEQTKSDLPGLEGRDEGRGIGDTVKEATGKEERPERSR